MTPVRESLPRIYQPIRPELDLFSKRLKSSLVSPHPLVQNISSHLLNKPGKWLRPALAIFSSRLAGRKNPRVVPFAVAVELAHIATLVHDDIIDESSRRRGQPTVYSKWGKDISIIAGDYLYAKACTHLTDLDLHTLGQLLLDCAKSMCEGQFRQVEKRNGTLLTEKEYLRIAEQKTASLFRAACLGGALLSGIPKKSVSAIGLYGYYLGVAFQIADDCLDMMDTGVDAAGDIRVHDATLPYIYFLRSLRRDQRLKFLSGIDKNGSGIFRETWSDNARQKAIADAMRLADVYMKKSIRCLSAAKNTIFREGLRRLAYYGVHRVYEQSGF
jgi:heptaprenyl diphosphate synthase